MANPPGYVNLLNSQIPIDLESPEATWFASPPVITPPVNSTDQKDKRRKWDPFEDKILIGAWLNTSKDPVISTDQKADAFWTRIVDHYNASPLLVGLEPRKLRPAKARWTRINEQVSKFAGCYDAALREQRSGQNDDNVTKAALDIFFNNNGVKFILDYCWRELWQDQKWCASYTAKDGGKEKRKPPVEVDGEGGEEGEPERRPVGVKAAKAGSKKNKSGREVELTKLQGVLEIKDKLSRQKILERLLAKPEPLS